MSKFQVLLDGHTFEIEIDLSSEAGADTPVRVNGEIVNVRVLAQPAAATLPEWVVIGDRPYEVVFDSKLKHLYARGKAYALQIRDLETGTARPISGDGRVKAPIPGIVTQILVNPGDAVIVGQPIMILEAMKMENQIRAPRNGMLTSLHVNAGDGVVLGQLLAEIT